MGDVMGRQTTGPNYRTPPIEGWYDWVCPVCGDICSDREVTREAICHKDHQVKLTVVGTKMDGYTMVAEEVSSEDAGE